MPTTQSVYIAGNAENAFVEQLKRQLGVQATWHVMNSITQHEVEAVEQGIQACSAVIFVFNEETRYHREHTSEFLALQKSYEDRCCNIIVLTSRSAAVPHSLQSFPELEINTEDPHFWEELKTRVDRPLVLSVGNVAHGLVQNYVFGYLRRILTNQRDEHGQEIPNSSYPALFAEGCREAGEQIHSSNKLIILLPKSCTCKDSLSEYDSSMRDVKDIEGRYDKVGQWKKLRQPIYSITINGQTWIVMTDVPNIMTAISKLMSRDGVHFTDEHLAMQYTEFHRHLVEALSNHETMRHRFLVVQFDDSDPSVSLGELLVREVEQDNNSMDTSEGQSERDNSMDTSEGRVTGQYKYDACFIMRKESEEVSDLVEKLKKEGLKVYRTVRDRPIEADFGNAAREIRNSKKTVAWFNETELKTNSEEELLYSGILEYQDKARRGVLLPVFEGEWRRLSSRLPYLRGHNHLFSLEPDFYAKLKAAITGSSQLMYPIGDIASGMAWAYCMNYLELALPEYVRQYNKYMEADPSCETFPYFICLTPASCRAPGKLTDYDSTIERKEKEIEWEKMVAGSPRTYNIAISVIRHGGKVYKVMAEFSTPLSALAECELGMQTQMSGSHKQEQKVIYDKLLKQIVQQGELKGTGLKYCKVLCFEDDFEDPSTRHRPKFNLSQLIAELIESNK